MFILFRRASKKVGLPLRTLLHIEEKKTEKVKITITDYDEKRYEEKELDTIKECFPFKDKPSTTWINIDGIHKVETIEKIGRHFNIHPLVLEDIVKTGQQTKMDDFEDYIFVILKMLSYDKENKEIKPEQVSLILGPNFVITFHEREGDLFNPIRENQKGQRLYTKDGGRLSSLCINRHHR